MGRALAAWVAVEICCIWAIRVNAVSLLAFAFQAHLVDASKIQTTAIIGGVFLEVRIDWSDVQLCPRDICSSWQVLLAAIAMHLAPVGECAKSLGWHKVRAGLWYYADQHIFTGPTKNPKVHIKSDSASTLIFAIGTALNLGKLCTVWTGCKVQTQSSQCQKVGIQNLPPAAGTEKKLISMHRQVHSHNPLGHVDDGKLQMHIVTWKIAWWWFSETKQAKNCFSENKVGSRNVVSRQEKLDFTFGT